MKKIKKKKKTDENEWENEVERDHYLELINHAL